MTRLLVANILLFFLVAPPGSSVYGALLLYPPWTLLRPWTVFTYMFLHANTMHLVFNMIGLFFFGPRLEVKLGGSGFLKLYFLSGLGGAALSFIFAPGAAVVGASAAVFGILIGFAHYWPREHIYIWGVLPVQARILAFFLVITSLYSGIAGANSAVAHFAHLGGLAFGYAYLRIRDRRAVANKMAWQKKVAPPSDGVSDREALRRWSTIRPAELHELNRSEVEELLAKATRHGVRSLTPDQRAFLDRMAHH